MRGAHLIRNRARGIVFTDMAPEVKILPKIVVADARREAKAFKFSVQPISSAEAKLVKACQKHQQKFSILMQAFDGIGKRKPCLLFPFAEKLAGTVAAYPVKQFL